MESSKLFYKIDVNKLENVQLKEDTIGFEKPRLVAFYDVNYDIIKPARKIFYFKMPETKHYPIDLNRGYSKYIFRSKPQFPNNLGYALKYAMSPEAQMGDECFDKIKVYTKRGTLYNLMLSYYNKNYSKYIMRVMRYNEDLYIIHVDKDEGLGNKRKKCNTHHEQLLKTVFAESPNCKPNKDDPCDENERFIGVHRSTLGKFEMIYHGEIHGIQANEEIKDFDDLENINACRFVMAKQMWSHLKNSDIKYLQYWLQAHLANVSDLYFAYKDRAGIVREPIVHKPKSTLLLNSIYKKDVCTKFLHEFLERINELLVKDGVNDFNTVYEICFDPEFKTFTYKIFKENTDVVFIEQDYIDYCKKL